MDAHPMYLISSLGTGTLITYIGCSMDNPTPDGYASSRWTAASIVFKPNSAFDSLSLLHSTCHVRGVFATFGALLRVYFVRLCGTTGGTILSCARYTEGTRHHLLPAAPSLVCGCRPGPPSPPSPAPPLPVHCHSLPLAHPCPFQVQVLLNSHNPGTLNPVASPVQWASSLPFLPLFVLFPIPLLNETPRGLNAIFWAAPRTSHRIPSHHPTAPHRTAPIEIETVGPRDKGAPPPGLCCACTPGPLIIIDAISHHSSPPASPS
ncbi:hypothetical protein B0T19DRAFT_134328 [Cercophora scortea]|uniref:Uncharacterized protein n=1 Tax=Cercophora scortea TaxID=314031 RepID=A0AAE0MID4_9PEZI|nr:hypothetical protein B0T19DRAFT_134328 [Cercophora scortea]